MSEIALNSPNALIEMAISQGADVDKLERLMQMKERWDIGQAKKAYFEAISEFQSICPVITKNKQGHNYFYAPLSDIIAQIREPLKTCGLSYRFSQDHKDGIEVTCHVTHIHGHSETSSMSAPLDTSGSKNAVQSVGSTVTYLQRYTLLNVLGIATADSDMDGRLPNDKDYKVECDRIIEHVATVRDFFDEVAEVKERIANDDVGGALLTMKEIPHEAKNSLWRAPTKGGIFTTAERAALKNFSGEK